MGQGTHTTYKFDLTGDDDFYVENHWNYFLMGKFIYSSRYGVTTTCRHLDDKDCLDLWSANWSSWKEKEIALCALGGKRFYNRCKNLFDKEEIPLISG